MGQKKQIDRYQINCLQEIFVDLFAGGGGASMGIEQAICLPIFAAVNHDPDAIAQHAANHKWTKHYQTSVWDMVQANFPEYCAAIDINTLAQFHKQICV